MENIFFDTAGGGYLQTDHGITGVNATEYNLLFRVINSDQTSNPMTGGRKPEIFHATDLNIIKAAVRRTHV